MHLSYMLSDPPVQLHSCVIDAHSCINVHVMENVHIMGWRLMPHDSKCAQSTLEPISYSS